MKQEELDKIIENHKHWLRQDCKDWVNMKADLYCEKLTSLNLSNADLRFANLKGIVANNANLSNTRLDHADLSYADLSNANLSRADIGYVDLSYTDLNHANLYFANMYNTNLCCANFQSANLESADLRYARLDIADLRNANLLDSNMEYANLDNTKLDDAERFRLGIILTKPLIGYKKTYEGEIIQLEIPKGAVVFAINGKDCRTNKAIVKNCKEVQHSIKKKSFEYKEGNIIEIKNFNMQYNIDHTTGIHFFRTKEEAKAFSY